jgi:hypothetical protein
MARISTLTLNREVLDRALNNPNAEQVGAWMRKRGDLALGAAKRQVGVKTGALRRSLRMSHLRNSTGQYLTIWTMNSIAYIHHYGTRPHIIRPKQGNKVLKFSRGSQVVYTRVVKHPGTKPNPYLTDQLKYFIP